MSLRLGVCLALAVLFTGVVPAVWAETVRVATWNVENYGAVDRKLEDGTWQHDAQKPESEKAGLRAILKKVRPDVLAVQEIGGASYLAELQRDLRREGLDYPFTALVDGPDPERKVAVLSRLPFRKVVPHERVAFTYLKENAVAKRGLLEVHFQTQDKRVWTLYSLHLKSRRSERPDDPFGEVFREREARAFRDLIRRQFPEGSPALYLVAGDFNDGPRSSTLRRFLEISDRPLARLIPAQDSRGHVWTLHRRADDTYDRRDYFLASEPLSLLIKEGRAHIADFEPEAASASDHRLLWLDLEF